jgi:hypothetical protein
VGQIVVGQPYLSDGNASEVMRLGRDGDLIASALHGPFFEQARRGNVKRWTSGAAGITILKYDNVNPALVIWNKSVGYFGELVNLTISWAGTPSVAGNIGLGIIPAAGIGLGTPITAFAELATALNAKTLQGENPQHCKLATTSTIVALAAAAYIPIFSFPGATAAASTTIPPVLLEKKFNGEFPVPPGAALVLCGNVAQTAAMGVTLEWIDNAPL